MDVASKCNLIPSRSPSAASSRAIISGCVLGLHANSRWSILLPKATTWITTRHNPSEFQGFRKIRGNQRRLETFFFLMEKSGKELFGIVSDGIKRSLSTFHHQYLFFYSFFFFTLFYVEEGGCRWPKQERRLEVTRFFTYDPLIAGTVFCQSSTFFFFFILCLFLFIYPMYFHFLAFLLCIKRLSLNSHQSQKFSLLLLSLFPRHVTFVI